MRASSFTVLLSVVGLVVGMVGCGKDIPSGPDLGGGGDGGGATDTPPAKPPTVAFSVDRTVGDAPVAIHFTDQSSGSITSWHWDFGDGKSSTERSPSHVYTDPKLCIVRLTATGPGGSAIKAVALTINAVYELRANTRYGPFWPSHNGQPGDCDFDGHGPAVTCRASLTPGAGNQTLNVNLSMRAVETRADWTTAEGNWLNAIVLYRAPAGLKVKDILSATQAQTYYVDSNHDYDERDGGELATFTVMGDTDGDDVCNRTMNDTHMYVTPKYVRFRVGP